MPSPKKNPPSWALIGGDLWGGLAAMLVALPAAIAYGIAVYSLLGPGYVAFGVHAAIIGSVILGVVAPLFRGTPRLISAPSAPAAAVLAAFAANLLTGERADPERITALIILVTLVSGALQMLYGAIGGGRLIKYIPYPVGSGYLSAVGILILLGQAPNILGLPKGESLQKGLFNPGHWQVASLTVTAATIVGVVFARRITRKIPSTILGLSFGLVAYFGMSFWQPELRHLAQNSFVIGPIAGARGGILGTLGSVVAVSAHLPWSDLRSLVVPALTLSVLLSIDTLKTCVAVDTLTQSRHRSNRELVGQGAANVAGALCGAMAGSGAMGPTLVNLQSGGRTWRSGAFEGIFCLVAFALLGNLVAWVPLACLAGILCVVAVRMFDWDSFRLLRQRQTLLDFAVSAAVVVFALTFDLIAASGVGLALAILLFIREQSRNSVIRRKIYGDHVFSKRNRLPAEQSVLEKKGALIAVCELQGSLFFGTTDKLYTELEPDLKRCRFLILDLRRVVSVDITAAHTLKLFDSALEERGAFLIFSRFPQGAQARLELDAYFRQVGLTGGKNRVRVFETLDDAMQWAEDQILAAALPDRSEAKPPLSLGETELLRAIGDGDCLSALASCVTTRSLSPGEIIFKSGDTEDNLYLIRSGNVSILIPLADGSHHNLANFGRGDFFGEMGFLVPGRRSATARANAATELFSISREKFEQACRASPSVGAKVFAPLAYTLAVRMRRTDTELRELYDA